MTRAIMTGVLLATAASVVGFILYAIFCPGSFNYAEGDVGTWILLWRHGQVAALYGPPSGLPMWSSNYPPLYLGLVARLAPSDGAIVLTGRLLSLFGILLAAAAVARTTSRATGQRQAGLLAAALLLALVRVSLHGAVCYPDALAFGLGCVGVMLVAQRTPGWPLLAAVCFAASLCTKHSLIIFPSAVALWALWREPKKGVVFCALTAALLLVAMWRWQLLDALVGRSMAPWQLRVFLKHCVYYVLASLPALALGLVVLRRFGELPARARQTLEPWAVVFVLGLFWLVSLGRFGGGYNYMLELMSATVVLVSVALLRGWGGWLRGLVVAVTLTESLLWIGVLSWRVLPRSGAEVQAARAVLAQLPPSGSLVLAEPTWYSLAGGRLPILIPFLGTQMARHGRWDPLPLAAALHRREVPLVLLYMALDDPTAGERFPAPVYQELRRGYRLVRTVHDLHVYEPISP